MGGGGVVSLSIVYNEYVARFLGQNVATAGAMEATNVGGVLSGFGTTGAHKTI